MAELPRDTSPKLNPRVPVVGPAGQFKEPRCGPHPDTGGGMRIAVFNKETGEYGVFKMARDEGWLLYRDLCEGRYEPVEGGEPIVAPEYFDKWQRLVRARGETEDGLPLHRITNLPENFYHPEVYARRRVHTRGRRDVDVRDILGELPEKAANEAPKKGRGKKEPAK